MELIPINENKLKIILTDVDMEKYSLNDYRTDYEDNNAREVFRSILDEAKKQVGFDSDFHRVFIQLYPCKTGGGEMYISKTAIQNDDLHEKKLLSVIKSKTRSIAFSFDTIDNLISVCKNLVKFSDSKDSKLIYDGKKFFLIMSENEENIYLNPNENTFISEYGKRENLKNTLTYLGEHGKYICKENAIYIMSCM